MNYLDEPLHAPVPCFGIGDLVVTHYGRKGIVVSGSFLLPEGRAYRVGYEDADSGYDPEPALERDLWLRSYV